MRAAMLFVLSLLLPTATFAQSVADPPLFDPVTGYRLTRYRGVVPTAPEGTLSIGVAEARTLWHQGAIFVDVNPAPGAVRDDTTGRWTLATSHPSIPGTRWFPETGRGILTAAVEKAFLADLHSLRSRFPRRPIIVFCQADCWMSWNATLRLHRAGIRNILWFADGLDGWTEAGLPLTPAVPFLRSK